MLGSVEGADELRESVGVEKGLRRSIADTVGVLASHKGLYRPSNICGTVVNEPREGEA